MAAVDISSPAFSSDPAVRLFKLQRGGLTAMITNLGATVTSLTVPDARGQLRDVVLGFDTARPYQDGTSPYFGCVVGRVANRIAGAQFDLDGQVHHLTANDDPRPNTLHGGKVGFDKRIWRVVGKDEGSDAGPAAPPSASASAAAEEGAACNGTELHLALTSWDGEEGFPGRVEARVSYRLVGDGEMVIVMAAHAVDRDTPVSMAHHMYWNLGGHASGTVHDHVVRINASHYTPINANHIPTGEILPVAGSPFDFLSKEFPIGARMGEVAGGYDHNYVLHRTDAWSGGKAAEVLGGEKGEDGVTGEEGVKGAEGVTSGMEGPEGGRKEADETGKDGEAAAVVAGEKLFLAARVRHPETGILMTLSTNAPAMQFYTGNFLDGSVKGKGDTAYQQHAGFCLETQGFPNAVRSLYLG
ncbi:hypothetical protein CLOM_g20072 [Closterium sp. NIES-68]|nr:hypothetical protein CLOM_g20072 [Closterium sp. NIES-68]